MNCNQNLSLIFSSKLKIIIQLLFAITLIVKPAYSAAAQSAQIATAAKVGLAAPTTKSGSLEIGKITFASGWQTYGADYKNVAVTKQNNIVCVSGLAKGGSWGHIATLPAGFRPRGKLIFNQNNHDQTVHVTVHPDGKIMTESFKYGWVSLSGITFSTIPGKPISLRGGFTTRPGYEAPTYRRIGRTCILQGCAYKAGGGWGVFANLPKEARPARRIICTAKPGIPGGRMPNGVLRYDVHRNGNIQFDAVRGGNRIEWLSLSGKIFTTIDISTGINATELFLQNGTRHYGSPYGSTIYRKEGNRVCITGLVNPSNACFNHKPLAILPEGYRPAKRLIFNVNNHMNSVRLDIATNGEIYWWAGGKDPGWTSLNNIYFDAAEIPLDLSIAELTLAKGWNHHGGQYGKVNVKKSGNMCFVEGSISGSGGEHLATLPAGYRPTRRLTFNMNNGASTARVDVLKDGRILWLIGGQEKNWISLTGIMFSTTTGGSANLPLIGGAIYDGGAYGNAKYQRIGNIVYLEGTVKGGRSTTKAQLPAGFRPQKRIIFNMNSHENTARVDVERDGRVIWEAGNRSRGFIGLSGINFSIFEGKALNLLNGWRHYERGYGKVTYIKDEKSGRCYISGLARIGNWSKPIAQLPPDCRPSKTLIFNMNNNDRTTEIIVYPNGIIQRIAGGGGSDWISLGGLSFTTAEAEKIIQAKMATEEAKRKAEAAKVKAAEEAKKKAAAAKIKAAEEAKRKAKEAVTISEKSTNIDLYNKWVSYGSSYGKISATKTADNIVYVEGLVKSGNWGKIAVLPTGFRPIKHLSFSVNNHEKISRIDIYPNGEIKWTSGGQAHGWISLAGINFSTVKGTNIPLNTSRWNWAGATYRKVGNIVHLESSIEDKLWDSKGGTKSPAWSLLGTLPEGYRPKKILIFNETVHNNPQRIDIHPNGQIHWVAGTRTHKWISFSGITFNTENGTELKLVNKWKPYGSGFAEPIFARNGNIVVVNGLIKGGAFKYNQPVAILPEGYRPTKRLIFSMNNDKNQARIDVDTNGNICWLTGGKNGWITLSGVSFTIPPESLKLITQKEKAEEAKIKAQEAITISEKAANITLYNKWVSYGAVHGQITAKKDPKNNIVYLEGLVKNGNWGKIAVLPPGFRPPTKHLIFHTNSHENVSRVDVESNGTITWRYGNEKHGWASLSGIAFSTIEGTPIPLNTSRWKHEPGSQWGPATYRKVGNIVYLEGNIEDTWWDSRGKLKSPAWGLLGTLPPECRPKKTLVLNTTFWNKEAHRIDIRPDGQIHWITGKRTHKFISFSGLSFNITEGIPLKTINNWKPYEQGFMEPTYKKEGNVVYVQGLIKGGKFEYEKPIAFLPNGFRPTKQQAFTVSNHEKQARVDVYPDGKIAWLAGGNGHGWLSLSGISFSTTKEPTISLLSQFMIMLEKINSISDYEQKIAEFNKLKKFLYFTKDQKDLYLSQLDYLINNREPHQIKSLNKLIEDIVTYGNKIIQIVQGKNPFVPKDKISAYTKMPQIEVANLINVMKTKQKIIAKPITITEVVKHTEETLVSAVAKQETKIAWINKVNSFVTKLNEASKEEIATIKNLAAKIKTALNPSNEFTKDWRDKFNDAEKTNLNNAIKIIEAAAATSKIATPEVGIVKAGFKETLIKVKNSLDADIVHKSSETRTTWLNNINILIDQRIGQSQADLDELNALIENISKNYIAFPLWFNKFSTEEKSTLQKLIEKSKEPIRFRSVIAQLNRSLQDGSSVKTDSNKTAWLNTVEYIITNLKKLSEQEASLFQKTIQTTQKWMKFPVWFNKFSPAEKEKLNQLIEKSSQKPEKDEKLEAKKDENQFPMIFAQTKNMLENKEATKSDQLKTKWINNLNFLARNKMGQSATDLNEFDLFIKDLEEKYIAFPLWFNKFSKTEQTTLKQLLTLAKTPLNFITVRIQTLKTLNDGSNVKTAASRYRWLNNFEFLINNRTGQSKEELEPLDQIIVKIKKWIKFPSWLSNFSANEQKQLNILIEKASEVPEEKAEEKKEEEEIVTISFAEVLAQIQTTLANNAVHKSQELKTKWINNLNFLARNKMGQSATDLNEFDLFIKDLEEKYIAFPLWFNKFSAEEKVILKQLLTLAKTPLNFITVRTQTLKTLNDGSNVKTAASRYKWLNNFEFLIDNRTGQPKKELEPLDQIIVKIKKWIKFPSWLSNFSTEEQKQLNILIEKASKVPEEKAEEKKEEEIATISFAEVLTKIQTSIANDAVHRSQETKTQWINNLNFLARNKIGQSQADLDKFQALINKIDENYIAFPLWFNKFSAEEKANLKQLIVISRKPLNYKEILTITNRTLQDGSNVKTADSRYKWLNNLEFLVNNKDDQPEIDIKTFEKIIATIKKWAKFPSWINKFSPNNKSHLNQLLAGPKPKEEKPKDFGTLLDQSKANLNKAITSEEIRTPWLKDVEYLIDNQLGKSTEKLNQLQDLISGIKTFMELFPEEAKVKLNEIITKGTIDYKQLAVTAKTNIRNAISSEEVRKTWLKTIDYLVENKLDKSEEETKAFKTLMSSIEKFKELFPKEVQPKINDLLDRGTIDYKKIAEKAQRKIRQAISSEQIQTKWLQDIEYLINNMQGKSEEELNALQSLLTNIKKYIDLFPEDIAEKLNEFIEIGTAKPVEQQMPETTIQPIMQEQVPLEQPTTIPGQLPEQLIAPPTSEQSKEETIADQVAAGKIDYSTITKQAKTELGKALVSDQTRELWLKKIEYLVDNIQGKSQEELDLLKVLINEIRPTIDLFPEEAKNKLKELIEKGDIDYKKVAQKSITNLRQAITSEEIRKSWLKDIEYLVNNKLGRTQEELNALKTLITDIEKYKDLFPAEVKTKLAELIEQGTIDYKKIIVSANNNISNALRSETERKTWLKTIEYLIDNSSGKTTEEIKALNELMQNVKKYLTLFPVATQTKLKLLIDKAFTALPATTISPTPTPIATTITATPVFENAKKTTFFNDQDGKEGKITLYKKAINLISERIPLYERFSIINKYLSDLTNKTLENKDTKTNLLILNTVNQLLLTAKTNLIQGLTNKSEQTQINDIIERQIKKITQVITQIKKSTSLGKFQKAIDIANAKTPYSTKINAFKRLFKYTTSSADRRALYMDCMNKLVEKRRPDQLQSLTTLITDLIGFIKYDPKFKGKYSLSTFNELKEKASKPIAYEELINRSNTRIRSSIESPEKKEEWFATIEYLANNMQGQSEENINNLSTLMSSISGFLKFNQSWAEKFSSSKKRKLNKFISDVETYKKTLVKKTTITETKTQPEAKSTSDEHPQQKIQPQVIQKQQLQVRESKSASHKKIRR